MKNLTLKHLRYVVAVADQGHFGRAADTCSVSQPALSMQIKELEGALGAVLFDRGARGVQTTALGARFVERARLILREVDELGHLARAAQDGLSGPLRLGVIPTIAPYLLPRLIGVLGQSHPGLELNLRETITPQLLDELANGQLDAAILALPLGDNRFVEAPLFTERFVLVRPIKDQHQPVPGPEALRELRLLLLEEGHCFRDQALSFCSLSASPREVMDGSTLATLVQMVGAGMGVTLIPEMAVPIETRSADVAVTRFPNPEPTRQIGLVWRRSSPLARQFAQLGEAVSEAGRAPQV